MSDHETRDSEPPSGHEQTGEGILVAPDAGDKVIRGGTLRGASYLAGLSLTAVASVFLLRHLGVQAFGQFVTVMSLVTIVMSVGEAGLNTVGQVELVRLDTRAERRDLLSHLLGLRLLLAPLGTVIAIAFAWLAGYDSTLVWGTVAASIGFLVFMVQSSLVPPLYVELRNGLAAGAELAKQAALAAAYGGLVVAGATLLPFFAVQIVGPLVAVAVISVYASDLITFRPRFSRAVMFSLIKKAIPLAISLALLALYLRLLMIMMSLMESSTETGLYATSFRIIEGFTAVPMLVMSTALPILTHAGANDEARLKYVVQRMTEVAFVSAGFIAIGVALLAETIVTVLGGDQYRDAAPVLRVQAMALGIQFIVQVGQLGLVSIHRRELLVYANLVALLVVFAAGLVLIDSSGAVGAASAAIAGELVLATVSLILLARARKGIAPDLSFVYKVVLAVLVSVVPVLVVGLPELAAAPIAIALFSVCVVVGGLLPEEIKGALMHWVRAGRAMMSARSGAGGQSS